MKISIYLNDQSLNLCFGCNCLFFNKLPKCIFLTGEACSTCTGVCGGGGVSVVVCHYKKRVDVARRRQTPYDVAILHLIVPMEPWQNFTPFFGAAAFCATKIDDFRASLTTLSTYPSETRSLRWTSSQR